MDEGLKVIISFVDKFKLAQKKGGGFVVITETKARRKRNK